MREVPPAPSILARWLTAERRPDAIAGHVLSTGHGRCWTGDGAVLMQTAGNCLLAGDPGGVDLSLIRGFVSGTGSNSW